MPASAVLSSLQRPLLVKAIAYQAPSREDMADAIRVTTEKLARVLQARFIRFHIDEGPRIWMLPAYFSPELGQANPLNQKWMRGAATEQFRTETGGAGGLIDRVIETGIPVVRRGRDLISGGGVEPIGFGVTSILIVPLRSTIILGAIEVMNKETVGDIDAGFTDADLELLQEVAEYACAVIHRMLDPKFQINAEDKARFVAKLTGLPLVTCWEEVVVDEGLARSIGAPVVEAEGVFPSQRLGPDTISVYLPNPLDQARRDSFVRSTGLQIDEVSVISTTLFDRLLSRYFKAERRISPVAGVDLESVAEVVTSAYSDIKVTEGQTNELEDKDSG
ncbi:MAG: hypothetical protein RIQ93_2641, partial [Verrucomicrobiota bacterium]